MFTDFLASLLKAMSPLEIIAALVSLICVILTARQSILNFPVGIVACVLTMYVFVGVKLYADAALQIFFIVVAIWGWWVWAGGVKTADQGVSELPVTHAPPVFWLAFVVGVGVCSALQGFVLHRLTDAAAPFVDSAIFWASVAAQWMIGRKYVENWLVWIGVDVVASALYLSKGLPVFSGLYALFCVLAVMGYVSWLKSGRGDMEIVEPRSPIAAP